MRKTSGYAACVLMGMAFLVTPLTANAIVIYSNKDSRITRGHSPRNDGKHTRLATQNWNLGHGKRIPIRIPWDS